MYIMIVTQCTRVYPNMGMSEKKYPVCICTSGLCLVQSVCVCIVLTKMGNLVPYHSKYLVECNYTACKCLLIEFKHLHGVWFAMHVQQFME